MARAPQGTRPQLSPDAKKTSTAGPAVDAVDQPESCKGKAGERRWIGQPGDGPETSHATQRAGLQFRSTEMVIARASESRRASSTVLQTYSTAKSMLKGKRAQAHAVTIADCSPNTLRTIECSGRHVRAAKIELSERMTYAEAFE